MSSVEDGIRLVREPGGKLEDPPGLPASFGIFEYELGEKAGQRRNLRPIVPVYSAHKFRAWSGSPVVYAEAQSQVWAGCTHLEIRRPIDGVVARIRIKIG